MKLFKRFLVLALVVSSLATVGCSLFGGDSDSSYSPVNNVLNPNPESVPAAKVVQNLVVASPTAQVQQAVTESLKTLVSEVRISERQTLRASAVPSGVPGFSGNQATNINWLLGNLLAVLPNGGNISNGVLIESADPNSWSYQVATYTASTRTLEVTDVGYMLNDDAVLPPGVKTIRKITEITNCDATVNDGSLTKLVIGNGTTVKTRFFNGNGSLNGTLTISVNGGVSVEMANSLTASTDFVTRSTSGNTSYGLLKSFVGKETMKLTFSSAVTFNVVFEEGTNKANGSITISNLTGSYTMTEDIVIGRSAFKNGSDAPVAFLGATERKEYFGNETHANNLVFAGNAFQFGFNVNWENNGIVLENGLIQIRNIVKKAAKAGEPDANYAFSDGSASMLVRYTGKDYEKYGYIYSLSFAISGLAFDPTSDAEPAEGAIANITRTNSDNTQTKMTYKIVNGKPVLQPGDVAFAGGSEKITVDENNNTVVSGTVTVAATTDAPAEAKMEIGYESKRDAVTQDIKVKARVKVGAKTRTMFFTRKADKKIGDGNVYDGEKESDTKDATYTFTVDANGNGTASFVGDEPEAFAVSL
ncbi:MAG TPA: hypothetical protein PLR50_00130 [Candidatus Rifleibacterium sp.]|nr:hypothetical protein [Candidatus Rifleibacterium sp.]